MPKNRLEAFSDGVLAIIITIMVLELKAPHEGTAASLLPLLPALGNYLLSFVYVGIYWNNHHHLFQTTETVSGAVLWANLHLPPSHIRVLLRVFAGYVSASQKGATCIPMSLDKSRGG
jgi:hypothetical protein